MADYDISSNDDLKRLVRAETLYEDSPDELPESTLDDQIDSAKLYVHTKTGSDAWYTDRGLGLVLLGYTAAKAKGAVENISVDGWTVGGGDVSIDASGAGDPDQVQFAQYEEMIQTGLSTSDSVESSGLPTNINSASYIG